MTVSERVEKPCHREEGEARRGDLLTFLDSLERVACATRSFSFWESMH